MQAQRPVRHWKSPPWNYDMVSDFRFLPSRFWFMSCPAQGLLMAHRCHPQSCLSLWFPPGVFALWSPAIVSSCGVFCFVCVYDRNCVHFMSYLPVPGSGSQGSSHRGLDSWAAPAAWQQLPTKRGSAKASPRVPLNGFKPQGGSWGWPVASTGSGGAEFLSSCTYLSCNKISWSFSFSFFFISKSWYWSYTRGQIRTEST